MDECKFECNFCGEKPANWFGATSVTVCSKPNCVRVCQERWEKHCKDLDEEYGWEDSLNDKY